MNAIMRSARFRVLGMEPYSISSRLAKQMAIGRSSLMKWRPLSEYTCMLDLQTFIAICRPGPLGFWCDYTREAPCLLPEATRIAESTHKCVALHRADRGGFTAVERNIKEFKGLCGNYFWITALLRKLCRNALFADRANCKTNLFESA